MPLDTGAVAQLADQSSADERITVALESVAGRTLGETLRAARISRGLSLDQVALTTRIRARHLAAIEESRVDELPSPPFSTGYVRAYATAVGLDADAAAARFRREAPDRDEALHAPPGVRAERHGGLKLVGLAVIVIGTGVLGWNIARHAMTGGGSHANAAVAASATTAAAKAKPSTVDGPLALGAPLPPPPEATTPQPYVTPGLEAASGSSGAPVTAASSAAAATAAATAADPANQAGAPFVAKGAVYGVSAAQSDVILQATRPASVIIHGADGTVYFARHLQAGEAYRAPRIQTLVVSAPAPDAIHVFVGGLLKGPLTTEDTPLSKLSG
jgi:cytoskeleton protein RodZ